MKHVREYIGEVSGKHGKFSFCHYDEYIGFALREYGEFSEVELSVMSKFINEGDFVFDIGANIGAFTVPFSKNVGRYGKVFSFEPQKFIYKLLSKNISLNNLKNVICFNNAVGVKNSFLELDHIDYSEVGNFGGVSFKYDNSTFTKFASKEKYKVSSTKLDNFLYLKKCNFIKMDVELMEMDVLKGGEKFIKKFRPIMWIENHEIYPNEINKYLLANNYVPYWAYTVYFNKSNYFINDKNYYKNLSTLNTLAIPKENKKYHIDESFDKITDPFTKPQTLILSPLT